MKILFRIALAILALVVLALVGTVVFFDSAMKTAVEEGGSFAMAVPTHLDSVDADLFGGTVELNGLEVENPKGYAAEDFFSLRKAGLAVDRQSLSTDTVVIPEIVIEGVRLSIERTKDGTNYGKILDNLGRFDTGGGGAEPSEPAPGSEPPAPGSSKQFLIQRISLKDIEAAVRLDGLGQQTAFDVDVPDFEIEDVGNAEGSRSLSDILETVLREMLDQVAENGGGLLPEDLVSDIRGRVDTLRDSADEVLGDLREQAEGVLEGDVDTKELGDKAKEAVEGAKKGLEGLLKKKDG